MICQKNNSKRLAKNKLQGIAKNKLQKYQVKIFFQKISEKISTKNKLQKIAKNKLQIGKFVKTGSSKSLTFLLVCRNLPGKANLKINGAIKIYRSQNICFENINLFIMCSIRRKYCLLST